MNKQIENWQRESYRVAINEAIRDLKIADRHATLADQTDDPHHEEYLRRQAEHYRHAAQQSIEAAREFASSPFNL